MWKNWKTQIVTSQKLKMWQYYKTQLVTKLNKLNFTKLKLNLWQNWQKLNMWGGGHFMARVFHRLWKQISSKVKRLLYLVFSMSKNSWSCTNRNKQIRNIFLEQNVIHTYLKIVNFIVIVFRIYYLFFKFWFSYSSRQIIPGKT